MTLRLNGSTSGYVEIDAPATAGSNTLVLPNSNGSNGQALTTNGSGTLSWATIPWSTSGNNIYYTTGSVSVGTTNAQGKLQVASGSSYASMSVNADDLIVENSGNCGITIASPTTSTGSIYFSDSGSSNSGSIVYNHSDDSLQFGTTSTERMRINSTGTCAHFSSDTPLGANCGAASGTTVRMFSGSYGATGTFSGTESFRIWSNGDVQNTNNSYGAISDIKLKENIVDASSQWDDIKALRPVNYNFKEGQTHTQLGLIAQEVELVSPGLVSESPDTDEEGNDLGTVTKSVNYSVLYMKAVKALQEAMERIEILEASNATLEARLTALEGGNP